MNKVLIIIQRSNGDVLMSQTLVNSINQFYNKPVIDLLVNDDTFPMAKTLRNVSNIYQFSYKRKNDNKWRQERRLIKNIFRKYDLSINLTASDRSVIYAILASKNSISAVEMDIKKSWWKKFFLSSAYYFDSTKHILLNNLEPLKILNINHDLVQDSPNLSIDVESKIKLKLRNKGISEFFIFHPSAQYKYKIYPEHLRIELLTYLSKAGKAIVVTGGKNQIDTDIKNNLPKLQNIFDFIGETTLEEYCMLSKLSLAYIGMDTVNMHIAASQNKRIFAIFGPTNLSMWSPWSNKLLSLIHI